MTRECMDCGNRAADEVGQMCPTCGGPMADKLLYRVVCEECSGVGVHEKREGAEGLAQRHIDETDHDCEIAVMNP